MMQKSVGIEPVREIACAVPVVVEGVDFFHCEKPHLK
jgi:hypothetical protein